MKKKKKIQVKKKKKSQSTCYIHNNYINVINRSSSPEVFLGKSVLKISSKFTGEHPMLKFDLKLQSNFIEITIWHGRSPVNLLHIFRAPFPKNISGRLLQICFKNASKMLHLYSKFTGKHSCGSVISIKLLCNFKSHFSMGVLL